MNAPTLNAWTGEAAGYGTTTDALNLRAQPSAATRVLTTLPARARVIIWARAGAWLLVTTDPPAPVLTGWCHGDYLTPAEP